MANGLISGWANRTLLPPKGFDGAFLVDVTRGYMIVMLNPELGRMGIVHVFGNVG